jgi:PAS domain S-box-containing protein
MVIMMSEDKSRDEAQILSRIRALTALTESKCGFILDSLQAGVVIIEPENHIIVYVNPVAAQLIGLPKDEITGHICHSFICPTDEGRCPITDLRQQVDNSERVLLSCRCEKIQIVKTVSKVEFDGVMMLLESFIDITGRKRAEEEVEKHRSHLEELVKEKTEELEKANRELQRSRERFRQVAENAVEWIWEVDTEGLYTYSSDAVQTILGYTPEELVGKLHFYDLFEPESRDEIRRLAIDVFERRESFKNFINRNVHKDGTIVIMRTSGSPVLDRDGALLGYCGADVDITREKRDEECIRAALREKEIMLREIHHRVKNNLQIVMSILSLQTLQVEDPKVAEFCRDTKYRIKSMALIHESLYCSEDLASIDLGRHMRTIASQYVKSYGRKANSVNVSFKTDTVQLNVEKAIPCGLIVTELLSNAFKHGFNGQECSNLMIELSRIDEGTACMSICNDGSPFPECVDLQNPPSMGLQLVQDLVSQIGGTIELCRDGGTTFTVTFPL